MDPRLLLPLAMLACPVGMGLVMWWMMKGSNNSQGNATSIPQTPPEKLAALRARRVALETEIAETGRIAELEAKRDELRKQLASPQEAPEAPATHSGA